MGGTYTIKDGIVTGGNHAELLSLMIENMKLDLHVSIISDETYEAVKALSQLFPNTEGWVKIVEYEPIPLDPEIIY